MMVELHNVCKRYTEEKLTVDNVSFEVKEGTVF